MSALPIVLNLFVLLFAITIHEASHGWAAEKMGDPTAAAMGRVSLNPIAHIDPIGTVLLPLFLVLVGMPAFGWAKPVPVNPFNLKHPRKDNLWISLAGPAANLTAAAAAMISILILKAVSPGITVFLRSFLIQGQGFVHGFYPLEGLSLILFYTILINTYLAVFNLIPVPPLDGSGILAGLLSEQASQRYDRIRPFGFIIVILLIYGGLLSFITRPIELLIFTLIFF
ncbi:MAG: site-2 protease family protein [Candidatus Aminicenantales bacterium]